PNDVDHGELRLRDGRLLSLPPARIPGGGDPAAAPGGDRFWPGPDRSGSRRDRVGRRISLAHVAEAPPRTAPESEPVALEHYRGVAPCGPLLCGHVGTFRTMTARRRSSIDMALSVFEGSLFQRGGEGS